MAIDFGTMELPDELKKYDTAERRASFSAQQSNASSTDSFSASLPASLRKYDTPANRAAFAAQQSAQQAAASGEKSYSFTQDQYNWITNKYKNSWSYGYDDADQAAKTAGTMPTAVSSAYDSESSLDSWLRENSLPNSKEIDSYLSDYDTHQAYQSQLNSFYSDAANSMYVAEQRGVKRGSEEWTKLFYDTLQKDEYSTLWSHFTAAVVDPTDEDSDAYDYTATPEQNFTSYVTAQQKADKAAASIGDDSFSFADFTDNFYGKAVTRVESEVNAGALFADIRTAAQNISYSETDDGQRVVDTDSADQYFRSMVIAGRSADAIYNTYGGLASEDLSGFTFGSDADALVSNYANVANTKYAAGLLAVFDKYGYTKSTGWFTDALSSDAKGALQTYIFDCAKNGASQSEMSAAFSAVSGIDKSWKLGGYNGLVQTYIQASGAPESSAAEDAATNTIDSETQARRDAYDLNGRLQDMMDSGTVTSDMTEDERNRWATVEEACTGAYAIVAEYDANPDPNTERPLVGAAKSAMDTVTNSLSGSSDEEVTQALAQTAARLQSTDPRYTDEVLQEALGDNWASVSAALHRGSTTEGASAEDYVEGDSIVAAYREEAKAAGYTDFEVDNALRAAGLPAVSTTQAVAHYKEYLLMSNANSEYIQAAINGMSDDDLYKLFQQDTAVATDTTVGGYLWQIPVAAMRGLTAFAGQFVSFADMIAHGFDSENGSWEITKDLQEFQGQLYATAHADNSSPVVATLSDAGSEILRMYLTYLSGKGVGKLVGNAFVASGGAGAGLTAEAATTAYYTAEKGFGHILRVAASGTPFITGAIGSSYTEARSKGATNKQATAYALIAGTIEGATEAIGGDMMFNSAFSKQLATRLANGSKSILTSKYGFKAVQILSSALGNGMEEGLSYFGDLIAEYAIYNKDAKFSVADLWDNVGMGMLVGGLGGLAGSASDAQMSAIINLAERAEKTGDSALVEDYLGALMVAQMQNRSSGGKAVKLSRSEYRDTLSSYFSATRTLVDSQKAYENTVSALNADTENKEAVVSRWKNLAAKYDVNTPEGAKAAMDAAEQVTIAEQQLADAQAKNKAKLEKAARDYNSVRTKTMSLRANLRSKLASHGEAVINQIDTEMGWNSLSDIKTETKAETSAAEKQPVLALPSKGVSETSAMLRDAGTELRKIVAAVTPSFTPMKSLSPKLPGLDPLVLATAPVFGSGKPVDKPANFKSSDGTGFTLIGGAESASDFAYLNVVIQQAEEHAASVYESIRNAARNPSDETAGAALDAIYTDGLGIMTEQQQTQVVDAINDTVAERNQTNEDTAKLRTAIETATSDTENAAAPTQQAAAATETKQTAASARKQIAAAQQAAVDLGKKLGITVEVADLPKGLAGQYKDGKILINSNNTAPAMTVLSHEMSHYIEGTDAYQAYADYVMKAAEVTNPDTDVETEINIIKQVYAEYRKSAGEAAYTAEEADEEAKAEFVANWTQENILQSQASIDRLVQSQEGVSLGKKILRAIQSFIATRNLRTVPEAAAVLKAEKKLSRALWAAKQQGAGKTNRNSIVSTLAASGLRVDGEALKDGVLNVYRDDEMLNGKDKKVTIEDIKKSPIGAFCGMALDKGNVTYDQAGKVLNLFTDLANLSLRYNDGGLAWSLVGGYAFSAMTANSDPQYNTSVDFGTICRKTQNVIDAMSAAMVARGDGLSPSDILELERDLATSGEGIVLNCPVCYVFTRWIGMGGYLSEIKRAQDSFADKSVAEAAAAYKQLQEGQEMVTLKRTDSGDKGLINRYNESILRHLSEDYGFIPEEDIPSAKTKRTGWYINQLNAAADNIYTETAKELKQYGKVAKALESNSTYQSLMDEIHAWDSRIWMENVLFTTKKGELVGAKNTTEDGKYFDKSKIVVPGEILFDLNRSDELLEKYPDTFSARSARSAHGSAAGKTAYGYVDSRLGEITYGVKYKASNKSMREKMSSRYGDYDAMSKSIQRGNGSLLSFTDRNAGLVEYADDNGNTMALGQFPLGGREAFDAACKMVKAQNLRGGQRMQSSSDYTSAHALDYLMSLFELQCLGAKVQFYTKVPEGATMLASAGCNGNLSLMPKGKGYTDNGELSCSSVTGMDLRVAADLASKSDNLQMIMVAVSPAHARATGTWTDPATGVGIDFMIPWHRSGGSSDRLSYMLEINGEKYEDGDYVDATNYQSDEAIESLRKSQRPSWMDEMIKTGEIQLTENGSVILSEDMTTARQIRNNILAGIDLSEEQLAWLDNDQLGILKSLYEKHLVDETSEAYGVTLLTRAKAAENRVSHIYPYEYWDTNSTRDTASINGQRMQEYCKQLGVAARFTYGKWDLSQDDYYWSTLIDRPMYNVDGTYHEQGRVDISGFTLAQLTGDESMPKTGNNIVNKDENAEIERQSTAAKRIGTEFGTNPGQTAQEQAAARVSDAVAAGKADIKSLGSAFGKKRNMIDPEVMAKLRTAVDTYGAAKAPKAGDARPGATVPAATADDGRKTRKSASSFMQSPGVDDATASELGRAILRGEYSYTPQSNKATLAKAGDLIGSLGGYDATRMRLANVASGKDSISIDQMPELIAAGELMIADAAAKGDANAAMEIIANTTILGTSLGQATQAMTMIKKMSPQGRAYYLQRVIDRLNNVDYAKQIASGKMDRIQLTEDQVSRLLGATSMTEASRIETEILTEIAEQLPVSLSDRLRNWRYLAMLGNARTHVRNLAGNLSMSAMRTGKDAITAGMESISVKLGWMQQDERTHSLTVTPEARELAKALLPQAKLQMQANTRESIPGILQKSRKMFSNEALDAVGKWAMNALDTEDGWFFNPQFTSAVAQLVTARGYDVNNMTKEQTDEAMSYGVRQALEATFRDSNTLASKLSQFRDSGWVSELILGGILPFTKTPFNIVRRGVEYSPIGLANGVYALAVGVNNGKYTKAQALDKIGRGLTGVSLSALGYFLASLGVLRGVKEKEDRAEYYLEDMGHQPFSIEIPCGGGKKVSITMDWATPANMPLFTGVALYDQTHTSEDQTSSEFVSDVFKSLLSLANPLMEMSMLKGLSDALTTSKGNDQNDALVQILEGSMESFAGQFVPTISGQLARTVDWTRRNKDKSGSDLKTFVSGIINKTPGLSYISQPYVGGYGTTDTYNNGEVNAGSIITRSFEQLICPGYIKVTDASEMTTELERLYDATGEVSFLPTRPNDYEKMTIDNKSVSLTPAQQTEYQILYRQTCADALKSVIETTYYYTLTDEQRVDALTDAYNAAGSIARKKYKQIVAKSISKNP